MADVYTRIGYIKGDPGAQGVQGVQGDPGEAATIQVGTVTTVPYGQTANVVNSGTEQAAVFDFTIPQGRPGQQVTEMDNLLLNSITTSSASFPIPAVGETGKVLWGKVVKFFSDIRAAVNSKIDTSKISTSLALTQTGNVADATVSKVLNDKITALNDSLTLKTGNFAVNSKITVTEKTLVKYGNVADLNLSGTVNEEIPSWEIIIQGMPNGFKPYASSNNAYIATISGEITMANFNSEGVFNVPVKISANKYIRFHATFLVR